MPHVEDLEYLAAGGAPLFGRDPAAPNAQEALHLIVEFISRESGRARAA